jgi:hypothetical protein
MVVQVMRIGPIRAQVFGKKLTPSRLALVLVEALPSGTRKGDTVEMDAGWLGVGAYEVPTRREDNGIRCSY